VGSASLFDGVVRVPDVTHLPFRHEFVQGFESFFDWHPRVRRVMLIQVHIVGLEPIERLVDSGANVGTGPARADRAEGARHFDVAEF
jgi:hypothetical protein